MKKIFPLTYRQTGLEPHKRLETSATCRTNVEFNIREVEAHTINPAVSLIDRKTGLRTSFFSCEDSFWMQDRLNASIPYSRQLMFLCGHQPVEAKKPDPHEVRRGVHYQTPEWASQYNEQRMEIIKQIGLILMRSPSDDGHGFRGVSDPLRGRTHVAVDGNIRAVEESHDSNFRAPPRSSYKDRVQVMAEWLDNNVIACEGDLFVRVPKPILVGVDNKVDWQFEGLVPRTVQNGSDSWDADAYQTELTELDNLLISVGATDAVFMIDFVDESLFSEPDYAQAVMDDFKEGLRKHVYSFSQMSDAYLLKWMELRALARLNDQWGDYGYHAAKDRPDDSFIENVATVLTELGKLKGETYSGAELWLSRKVRFPESTSYANEVKLHL